MGPGSLRRAIERKSPMLLHRSIRTGSSTFANYRATGRSLAQSVATAIEVALLLFNSVYVTVSTICRISSACAQARIETEPDENPRRSSARRHPLRHAAARALQCHCYLPCVLRSLQHEG